jgi:hypothetical protein
MSKKIKNLCVATSKYTNRDGQEKTNWLNIGAIIQKDDGGKFMIMNRTFNPAGIPNPENKDTFIVSMFDVEKKDGASDSASSTADIVKDTFEGSESSPHFSDDDIPF